MTTGLCFLLGIIAGLAARAVYLLCRKERESGYLSKQEEEYLRLTEEHSNQYQDMG